MSLKENACHGCTGKGWVSPNGMNAVICPVCTGSGVYAKTFDWKVVDIKFDPPQATFDEIMRKFNKTLQTGSYTMWN